MEIFRCDFFKMKFLKDKRVDKILDEAGIKGAEIFYSPVALSFFPFFILVVILNIFFLNKIVFSFSIFFVLMDYLLVSFLNNSLAIRENFMYVINPNFPFNRLKKYELKSIQRIRINCKSSTWQYFFLILSGSFIQIITEDKTIKKGKAIKQYH